MSPSSAGRSSGKPRGERKAAAAPRASNGSGGSDASTGTPAAGPWPNVLIRASAGTGKTFQLSNRYLQLVGAGVRPESILAATFARKAAGEILARVILRLADAALDDTKCDELARQVGWSLDRPACRRLLAELTGNLHRLRIGTLDSFFIRLAGSLTLELGLPTDWQIVETLDDSGWRLEAVRRVLSAGSTAELMQLVQLLFKGETNRSISDQIGRLVTQLYDVYCESDHAAWHELKGPPRLRDEEVAAAIDALIAAQPAATLHKTWQADIGRALAQEWDRFIKTGLAMAVARDGMFRSKPIDPDLAALYRPLLDHATGVLVGQLAAQTEATCDLLKAFAEHYRAIQRQRSGLVFADVPRLLAEAVDGPMWQQASWRLDGSIQHLLIDEFQDTSLAQWRVLRPLATACCHSEAGRSFFSVGDVKQAIYRWRGGVSQIFDAASEELPGTRGESLSTSRRSCQAVIDAVNQVFGTLPSNAALANFTEVAQAWHDGFIEHTTAKQELAGYVELSVAPRVDGKPKEQAAGTLEAAAAKVAQLAAEHPTRSIGVLVRTNTAVRQLIHRFRSRHQILASEEGGNPLVDSPAVQIAISALTLADHPGDTAARFHVAHSPLGRVLGIVDHQDDAAAHAAMADLRRRLLDVGYGRTLYAWAKILAAHCDRHDLRRLEQLVALGFIFGPRAGVRPSRFVTLIQETKVEDPAASQVRVMTVHQAKGLEFDIVVLPELDKMLKGTTPTLAVGRERPIDPIDVVCRHASEPIRKLLPDRFQKIFEIWPREAVGESLCLLYVAMTRAVHALYICVAPTGLTKSGPSPTIPKTFAGILRSALVAGRPLEPNEIAFAHGNPHWDQSDAGQGTRPQLQPAAEKPNVPQPIRLRTSGQSRSWERRSPSQLEGGNRVRVADVLRSASAGFARGSLWHAWLEKIEWLEADAADRLDKNLFRSVDRSLSAGLDVEAELAEFCRVVIAGPIRSLLARQAYADPRPLGFAPALVARLTQPGVRLVVERERRFALVEDNVLVTGSLDRLVTWQAADGRVLAADLIDFKTDRPADDAQLAERIEFYRPQIAAYRRAAGRLFALPPDAILGRLVFLHAGRACAVE